MISYAYLVVFCVVLCQNQSLGGVVNKCSFKEIAPFIVGGAAAAKGQFPWQVGINITTTKKTLFCGGSIIDANWILTSAYCIQGAQEAKITAGSTRLDGLSGQIQKSAASRFILHEEYEFGKLGNNIGLIRLETNLVLNGCDVDKIDLPHGPITIGTTALTSGWGSQGTSANTTIDDKYLNYVSLVILNQTSCEQPIGNTPLPPEILCASSSSIIPKGICSEDIGGPLVVNAATNPTLIGISSFYSGKGCTSGDPSWFINTYYYRTWIEAVTNKLPI